MSVTECNSDTTQKLPFGVSTTVQLQNVRNTSDITGTLVSWNTPRYMPVLCGAVLRLSPIAALTAIGQFLDCATVALSERQYFVCWMQTYVAVGEMWR